MTRDGYCLGFVKVDGGELGSKQSQEPLNQLQDERPSALFWLSYLFFMPTKFFKHFVIESTPWLTVVCAWTYGMVAVIDRLDRQTAKGHSIVDTWATYWAIVAIAGIVAGAFHFHLGGWWYRLRLKWSGALNPDIHLARRIYLFASQVIVIPSLLFTAYETRDYVTPTQAEQSEGNLWQMLLLLFPFWSVWVSYIGARTAFVLRRWPARIWFLILPIIFYAIFIVVFAIGFAYLATAAPADVTHPITYEGYEFSFSYPKNWTVKSDKDYAPNVYLSVLPPQDAAMNILLLRQADFEPEEALESATTDYENSFSQWRDEKDFQEWGSYNGIGKTNRVNLQGDTYTLTIFVYQSENAILRIDELYLEEDKKKVLPGFELIRSTFRLK